jgi:hypothetical protein
MIPTDSSLVGPIARADPPARANAHAENNDVDRNRRRRNTAAP